MVQKFSRRIALRSKGKHPLPKMKRKDNEGRHVINTDQLVYQE